MKRTITGSPKVYSPTYPDGWTEEQRAAAYAEIKGTPEEKRLLQECETPPDFWKVVNDHFQFQIDVCASPHNAKCGRFIHHDSLADDIAWCGFQADRAWCNPGFSDVLPWHEKAYSEAQDSASALVVVIGIPGASQAWYKFAETYADEIITLAPRVQYLTPWPIKQQTNTRESVLYVYRRKVVATRPATHTHFNWK